MSDTPSHWDWMTLEEVGEWTGGGTPSKRKQSYWQGGTVPWVSPKDMKSDEIHDTQDHLTQKAIEESSSAKPVPSGAVLFVTRSGILEHTLPTALTKVEATINQDLKALIPGERIDSKFLFHYTREQGFSILRECSKDGTTVASLKSSKLYAYPIPVPPLAEQRRIVAKIEELLSGLDAGLADLRRTQRQLRRYRRSVLAAAVSGRLTAAVSGRLTAAWRSNHPTGTEPAEEPDTGGLDALPDGWGWLRFHALLSQKLRNGKSAKTAKNGKGVRVLTLTAVTQGEFTFKNTKIADLSPDEVETLWLQKGDLLIERSNTPELVGTTRLYRGEDNFAIFPDLVIRARVGEAVDDRFAEIVLQSRRSQQYFEREARGTSSSMQKINQSII